MDKRADGVDHAHRLWYHSTLGLRVIKEKKKNYASQTMLFNKVLSFCYFLFFVLVLGLGVKRTL